MLQWKLKRKLRVSNDINDRLARKQFWKLEEKKNFAPPFEIWAKKSLRLLLWSHPHNLFAIFTRNIRKSIFNKIICNNKWDDIAIDDT